MWLRSGKPEFLIVDFSPMRTLKTFPVLLNEFRHVGWLLGGCASVGLW